MSQEVTKRESAELVHPLYGDVLDVANEATDSLAGIRSQVVEDKRSLDQYAFHLDAELTGRLDAENTRSAEVGQWRIETKAPQVTKYPADALSAALDALIAAGKLSESVKDRCLVPQPPKPDLREVNKLLRHADEDVRNAVAEVAVQEEQRRTVKVSRA